MAKTVEELLDEIALLPIEKQHELSRTLHEQIAYRSRRQLRPGTRVSFPTKAGITIEGVVERVNLKSVKISAKRDRYGQQTPFPVTWHVSPQLCKVLA